jgi:hypothetical protein
MNEVRLNILDAGQALNGTVHGSVADSVVAALSAEPETIQELQNALARFIKPTEPPPPFALFGAGTNEEPWDAGIVFVDLAARVVAAESTYSTPSADGLVQYHEGVQATELWLPYRVPADWLFVFSIAEYTDILNRRRAERAAAQPLDTRAVLYGAIAEFIVGECIAARDSNTSDPVAEIHARWLTTPRDDLQGLSPRDTLLMKREFIDTDLQSRELQWSFLNEPAPCLPQDCAAYRFAGFGMHEVVVYYDLVRHLISKCWKRVRKHHKVQVAEEVARLEKIKIRWLEGRDPDFDGRSPAYVIECERKRLPLIMSPEEVAIDDDCPLCRAMRDNYTPTFWHLDGCNMDDDFPFSLCRTRDEWEEEEHRRKEFDLRWRQESEPYDNPFPPADNDSVIH